MAKSDNSKAVAMLEALEFKSLGASDEGENILQRTKTPTFLVSVDRLSRITVVANGNTPTAS